MFDTNGKESFYYYLDSISFILVTESFVDENEKPIRCSCEYRSGMKIKPVIKIVLPNGEDVYLASRYTMFMTDNLPENATYVD